jgi:hypothetical protein
MEIDYQCVFCQRCDINLYEMNENSVLIEGVLVDFKDLVVDLFSSKVKQLCFSLYIYEYMITLNIS